MRMHVNSVHCRSQRRSFDAGAAFVLQRASSRSSVSSLSHLEFGMKPYSQPVVVTIEHMAHLLQRALVLGPLAALVHALVAEVGGRGDDDAEGHVREHGPVALRLEVAQR